MDIQPSEHKEFAAIESRLEAGNLTLRDIRDIEDGMLLSTDEKTKKFSEGVFSRIGQKRNALIEKEIVRLEGKTDIGSKVLRLKLLNADLLPEEADTEALALAREVPLEKDARTQATVFKQLEEIRFAAAQPLVHELDDGALDSNFASRVRQVAKTMVEQNSLTPFQGLNSIQQREVYRYAGRGGMSPEVLAHAIEEYIHALQHQVEVARAFYFGRLGEGVEGLLQLPEDIRLKIDQLIWEGAGGEAVDPTDASSQELITAAILHNVEERMGMHGD